MQKQVLNVALDLLERYWYVLVIALFVLLVAGWAWAKISHQHKLLKVAQERISWQNTQMQSKDLEIKQLKNAVLIEKEKQKDEVSSARIKALKNKNKGLRQAQAKVDEQTKKKKDAVKRMSLEELNKQINGE
jgi:hypothetical protein